MSFMSSAKSLMRRNSNKEYNTRPALVISEPFDAAAAMKRIQEYKGPTRAEFK
jgi:hypothetical protein